MNRRDFVKGSLFSGAAIAGLRAQTAAQREGVSPASRITVGVIGAGARAQQIMDAALTIPGIEIVAVSDAYWGRAQRARGRAGGFAKIHGDYREILADKGINGVLVYPDGFTVNLSSTFNNQTGETGLEILGTEGSLAFQGSQLVFRPENAYSDYRWVVDSWPKALAEAYYSDPKVLKEQSPST